MKSICRCFVNQEFGTKAFYYGNSWIINDYQVTLEEQTEIRKLIKAAWDQNQHMITLFANIKTHLTILVEMKNAIPYPEEAFIKAVYLEIRRSKQFTKVCKNGNGSQSAIDPRKHKHKHSSKLYIKSMMPNATHFMKLI